MSNFNTINNNFTSGDYEKLSFSERAQQTVGFLKNGCVNVFKHLFTDDRAHQILGDTPRAQAQGRDKLAKLNLVVGILALAIFGTKLTLTILHPGAANFILTGMYGAAGVFALREHNIQREVRYNEMVKARIGENKETTYTFNDCRNEIGRSFRKLTNSTPQNKEEFDNEDIPTAEYDSQSGQWTIYHEPSLQPSTGTANNAVYRNIKNEDL